MSELLSFILTQEDFRKARLPSLYSDFAPLQTVNPDGYIANITAWKTALSKATYAGLIPSSTSSTDHLILPITSLLLPSLTTREYGTPSLGCVINEGIASEEFIPLKNFLAREGSIYYKPWVDPWKVLSWGLRQVGVGGGAVSAKLVNGEVVVVKNVEEVSQKVIKVISRGQRDIDRIMTLETLEHEIKNIIDKKIQLSEKDMKVLVKHLSRDLGEASVQGKTIKFKPADSALQPISQSDITTAQLKHLIITQNLKVDALSSRITALQTKAKQAVLANNKITALSALKSKKMTEEQLQTVTNSLSSLESVLMKIEQAVDNAALIDTLEQGSKVLAGLNKITGGVERVEKVMDELQEQMDETDEISRIVTEPGTTKLNEIEDDVQEEFEALIKEEKERERKLEEERKRKIEEEDAKLLERLAGLNVADQIPQAANKERDEESEALPA
ncbi:hypothetical protein TWF106_001638 [Orbilia oligospora]|uniref:Charged multivesicular body protein 7 n=2 Tax=Orbilia oligospora TaxID=2813651 RepID=A0A6G1M1K0_ORBOL|nr:hypothetical protein TWF106_001638 [Orbilia oligospora]KAF3241028.1 hypothetical protein TWF192_009282 [Orbilia oligospora]